MQWGQEHDVLLHLIQHAQLAQNAYVERFNRTYRDGVLDLYLFHSLKVIQFFGGQVNFVDMTSATQRPSRVAKASFSSLSSWQLQSVLPPDALGPLTIDAKTVVLEHRRDDPVAIHRLLMRVLSNECDRLCLIHTRMALVTRRRAVRPHELTCTALQRCLQRALVLPLTVRPLAVELEGLPLFGNQLIANVDIQLLLGNDVIQAIILGLQLKQPL